MAKLEDRLFENDSGPVDWRKHYSAEDLARYDEQLKALAEKYRGKVVKTTPFETAHANARVEPEPSRAQIDAGNYRMGHIEFQGLNITIENPKGSIRSGIGEDGKPWSSSLGADYGYIKRTTGADGEQVDVYVGPNHTAPYVWLIDQAGSTPGEFDEHKALLGFLSEALALAAYRTSFSDAKDRVGAVSQLTMAEFRDFLRNGDLTEPYDMEPGEGMDTD